MLIIGSGPAGYTHNYAAEANMNQSFIKECNQEVN
jgi:thioredoxin reductase